jgi:nucleoside-diphosphate-sugar epimerase
LCDAVGLAEFHYVSTAFVCGDQAGPVDEEAYDWGHAFHNEYEQSKYEAERLVRQAPGLRSTVYRPSVIVGDSRTGHTSTFHGLYRFLSLADRLAGPRPANGRRRLDLRLPFQGDEGRDLVPVDWVARAIARLVNRPECHGKTYHLVAEERTPVGVIRDVAEEALGIDGVRLAGRGPLQAPTPLEEMFLGQLQEYWPYLDGDPVFDRRNTRAALPDLPAPRFDRALLTRLIRYAASAGWGRPPRARARKNATVDCARYLEEFFPDAARRSSLAKAPLDVTVALEVTGGDGGRWLCRWEGSELAEVRPDRTSAAAVAFRMDSATFAAVVRGRLTTQNAFFDRRVEIAGDVEKGLKLAVLFDHFVKEFPYGRPALQEVGHAVAVRD